MKALYKKLNPYFVVMVGILLLVSALFSGCTAFGNKQESAAQVQESTSNLTPPAANDKLSDARNTALVRAAKSVGPAVVGITNKAVASDWFNNQVMVDQGTGSGVIFDSNGYIVTNNHVVDGAKEITVALADGRTLAGKIVGTDPVTDIAVVKVDATGLPTVTFGNSDEIMVGEPALAIGNPLGLEFQGSVTAGVISALNRSMEIGERRFKLIQTDAAINPGNSGGALVNADGMVIGINSAKVSAAGVEGMGFAIPINAVRPIIEDIIKTGHVVRPYLGVGIFDKATAASQGYSLNIDKGVYVAQVTSGGPGEKAGLQKGDIILKIGDTEINTVVDLRTAIVNYNVGDKVKIEFTRNGEKHSVDVALEEMPASQ